VTLKFEIAADSGILPSARDECVRSGKALCVLWPFVADNNGRELIPIGIGLHAAATGSLIYPVQDIKQAKTARGHVIEKPVTYERAAFVPSQ